jgi:hypothetical protein
MGTGVFKKHFGFWKTLGTQKGRGEEGKRADLSSLLFSFHVKRTGQRIRYDN